MTAAIEQLGLKALRIGLLLFAAVSAGDAGLVVARRPGALEITFGVALVLTALAGARRSDVAQRLLRPRGRVVLPALVLAVLGAMQPGIRAHYADVEFALVCVASIVAGPGWVATCIGACLLGIVGDDLLEGRSLVWTLSGPGGAQLLTQLVVMVAGAAVWIGVIWVLRRTITVAPESLARARSGDECSLTPRLEAALRGEPAGLLVRASAAAVVEPLSLAERHVLELLAAGLLPKEAARRLELALPTVRSHIASAKRKTGARTLDQLVGLFAEAGHSR